MDHLGILNAIWAAETRDAQDGRYRELVTAALPPGYRHELPPQARWLFRTLRAAELAGLDLVEVTRTAIASRDEPPLIPGTQWAELNKARFICWWCTSAPEEDIPLRFHPWDAEPAPTATDDGSVTVTMCNIRVS